jgi:hypothetical protein
VLRSVILTDGDGGGLALQAEVEKPKEAAEEEKKKEDKPMDATAAAEDKPKDAAAAEDKPKDGEEKKDDAPPPPPPPPPPEEVEMRVYMHCEGCARKVKKILKRFDGNKCSALCLSSNSAATASLLLLCFLSFFSLR